MCSQARENCHHNVFDGLLVGTDEPSLVGEYLNGHDFADNTRGGDPQRPAKVRLMVRRSESGKVRRQADHRP